MRGVSGIVFPLGHAAVGYVTALLASVGGERDPPDGVEVTAVLFGTQLPDLVDKPLAYAGVLRSGRSFAHSLLVVGPTVALAYRVRPRALPRRVLDSLVIGYVSHLVADTYRLALSGRWRRASYLLWPVLAVPEHGGDAVAPWTRIRRAYRSPSAFGSDLALVALAVGARVAYRLCVESDARTVDP